MPGTKIQIQINRKKKKGGGKPATAIKEPEKKGPNPNAAKDSQLKPQAKEGADKAKDKVNPSDAKANPATDKPGPDARPITMNEEGDKAKNKHLAKAGSACDDEAKLEKDPEAERRREAEKLLQQRFKTFDLHFKDVTNLLEAWDRTQGSIFRQPSPSEKSEHEESTLTAGKTKKNTSKVGEKAAAKEKKDKDKTVEVSCLGVDLAKLNQGRIRSKLLFV